MKYWVITVLSFLLLAACKKDETKAEQEPERAASIFMLDSKWQNQEGKTLQLKDLKGKNLVITMIFTSCDTACPLLVADMKKIAAKISKEKLKETHLVFVSIDPEHDTPEVLKAYAMKHRMTEDYWVLLRSDKEAVRELANVLAVKYKKISPIVFSHSNIISVFNKKGEMIHQTEGKVNSEEVAKLVNGLN